MTTISSAHSHLMTPLTFTHLLFQARVRTPIRLGEYQGAERLRDALAQVMLRAVCPETQRAEKPSPLPVGFSPRKPTQARCDASTVYSLAGPQSPLDTLADNQNFLFTITLFGDGFRFLPYFVLAASAMGDTSVGPGRGKFEIVSLHAQNPLTGVSHAILSDGEKIVRPQSLPIAWNEADVVAREFSSEADVRIRFLSPTRLIDSDSLVKAPDFGIFFRR